MRHGRPAPLCKTHAFYDLTCDEYDRLWRRAHGRCELCAVVPSTLGFLHIDHRLGNWAVRGLLCLACNTTRIAYQQPDDHAVGDYLANPFHADRELKTRRGQHISGRLASINNLTTNYERFHTVTWRDRTAYYELLHIIGNAQRTGLRQGDIARVLDKSTPWVEYQLTRYRSLINGALPPAQYAPKPL
jgi:hypothetical protein